MRIHLTCLISWYKVTGVLMQGNIAQILSSNPKVCPLISLHNWNMSLLIWIEICELFGLIVVCKEAKLCQIILLQVMNLFFCLICGWVSLEFRHDNTLINSFGGVEQICIKQYRHDRGALISGDSSALFTRVKCIWSRLCRPPSRWRCFFLMKLAVITCSDNLFIIIYYRYNVEYATAWWKQLQCSASTTGIIQQIRDTNGLFFSNRSQRTIRMLAAPTAAYMLQDIITF